jgi:hypothetical protein
MSGKRAKPSRWRFVRVVPLAIVAVVVWLLVGVYLLLPGSGTDQAHDWGIDPVPSSSDEAGPADPVSSSPGSPETSTPGTATARESATAQDSPSSVESTAGALELSAASSTRPTARPRPRTTSDPTDPAPTQAEPGPPTDNPGKKKGHHKSHGGHSGNP